jgi:hypothetical protein
MTYPGPIFADAGCESLVVSDSDTALKPPLMTHPGPTFADAGCELLVVSDTDFEPTADDLSRPNLCRCRL